MNIHSYLKSIEGTKLNKAKITKIEELYDTKLPVQVKEIISNLDANLDEEDSLVLVSYQDIINPLKTYAFDFKKLNMIPLFDCFDNNFLTYRYDNNTWSLINLSDELEYMNSDSIENLLVV